MKFSLSNDEIKNNLENIIKQLEKELMLRLAAGGIDFEDFDPDTFEYNPDLGVHSGILTLVQKLENIKTKLDKYK
jgi:hypothetical protein